jgi:hypothetical protein
MSVPVAAQQQQSLHVEDEPLFDAELDNSQSGSSSRNSNSDLGVGIDTSDSPQLQHASSSSVLRSGRIDPKQQRYPFCLVWGPLPLISWIIPWIGHLGIGDSEGRVHDFAGPYTIGVGEFMTPVAKYWQLPRELWAHSLEQQRAWDAGVYAADGVYERKFHNLVTCNCHHHTAHALASMRLGGGGGANAATATATAAALDLPRTSMLRAWWLVTSRGRFVHAGWWMATYLPFIIGVVIIVVLAVKIG